MSFANPAWLWALPAAGLPALIHFLSRRSARRVPFSDLTLLAAVEARSRPRARLRDLLLLAARTLLILALILAAAGPTARGASSAAGEAGLDLVVLLDASYSTRAKDGGRARFETAVDAGARLLKTLAPGDRVAVGVFDEALREPLKWTDARDAAAALSRARPGLRGTDARPALKAAADLLSRSPRGRRRATVVLGDGVAHMLPGPAPEPADGEVVLGLRFGALSNAWVSGARAARGAGDAPRLEVRVAAAGAPTPGTLDLRVDGRRAGSGAAPAKAGGEGRADLALPPPRDPDAPAWSGSVSLPADALPDDDAAYFAVARPPAPRVLVLSEGADFDRAGRAGWFLRGLFGAGEGSLAGRGADFLESARWREADLSRYGVVLLADASAPPPELSSALERFAARGGGVWVIPGARAAGAGLAGLSSWLPARFGAPESAPPPGLKVASPGTETADWARFALDRVEFARRLALEPGPQARVVLTGDDGAPLLAAGPVGRGRGVVWAAPLDADDSNLGLKPVFVAWARACLALTLPPGAGAEAASARVGRPLVETWAHDRPAPDRVAVRLPGGRRTALEVRDRRAVLPSADAPGLYEFESPDGARMVFAVNLDPATGESDLTPLSSPPWTAVAPQDLDAAFTAAVYGRDRRGWALGLAALALCAEMLLSLPLRRLPALAAAALLLAVLAVPRASAQGDRFVWTQLKLGRGWDPYPGAPDRLTLWLSGVTSARTAPSRRVVALDDPELFFSPFLYLAGTEAPPEPTDAQLRRLRQYLAGGGFLWIEDAAGGPPGSFDAWVRAVLPRVLPGATLEPLPPDHVIYRTFFLLRGPAGCAPARGALEGVLWDGRAAVVYTRDDVLGAWALDALGRPLKNCPDREDARRLSLNLLMYSLTGSYKADAVHQAAILEKLKEAP